MVTARVVDLACWAMNAVAAASVLWSVCYLLGVA